MSKEIEDKYNGMRLTELDETLSKDFLGYYNGSYDLSKDVLLGRVGGGGVGVSRGVS